MFWRDGRVDVVRAKMQPNTNCFHYSDLFLQMSVVIFSKYIQYTLKKITILNSFDELKF